MRKANPVTEPEQVLPLAENLMAHLAKGREWATPGVQTALQRAVAGLDTGIETASPRLQAVVRRLADELAGGVETLSPRVQERLKRVAPKAAADIVDPAPVTAVRPASRMAWWIATLLAVAGFGVWRSLRTNREEPVSPAPSPDRGGEDFDADPDLAAGRI
ncbi:hypothetical protein QFZ70_002690 [Arthrobacter sp. V1I9]|uniref:hypothetical protein n=1 Tax=Arthrobacter sp. V1I9 TaxID=3042275 RepID=UPI00278F884E|nr:hypothetical protein [Arthrobacter sp. V1I9]MDQ0870217.1 hypothetical protein [Arthrobacter sp. V1I9]